MLSNKEFLLLLMLNGNKFAEDEIFADKIGEGEWSFLKRILSTEIEDEECFIETPYVPYSYFHNELPSLVKELISCSKSPSTPLPFSKILDVVSNDNVGILIATLLRSFYIEVAAYPQCCGDVNELLKIIQVIESVTYETKSYEDVLPMKKGEFAYDFSLPTLVLCNFYRSFFSTYHISEPTYHPLHDKATSQLPSRQAVICANPINYISTLQGSVESSSPISIVSSFFSVVSGVLADRKRVAEVPSILNKYKVLGAELLTDIEGGSLTNPVVLFSAYASGLVYRLLLTNSPLNPLRIYDTTEGVVTGLATLSRSRHINQNEAVYRRIEDYDVVKYFEDNVTDSLYGKYGENTNRALIPYSSVSALVNPLLLAGYSSDFEASLLSVISSISKTIENSGNYPSELMIRFMSSVVNTPTIKLKYSSVDELENVKALFYAITRSYRSKEMAKIEKQRTFALLEKLVSDGGVSISGRVTIAELLEPIFAVISYDDPVMIGRFSAIYARSKNESPFSYLRHSLSILLMVKLALRYNYSFDNSKPFFKVILKRVGENIENSQELNDTTEILNRLSESLREFSTILDEHHAHLDKRLPDYLKLTNLGADELFFSTLETIKESLIELNGETSKGEPSSILEDGLSVASEALSTLLGGVEVNLTATPITTTKRFPKFESLVDSLLTSKK